MPICYLFNFFFRLKKLNSCNNELACHAFSDTFYWQTHEIRSTFRIYKTRTIINDMLY